MKVQSRFVAALLATVALAACGNPIEPARKAVGEAEAALATLKDEAAKYVPKQLEAVDRKLATLKAAMEKQDYAAALADAPAVLAEAKVLAETIVAKKAEYVAALNGDWASISTSLPESVAALEARLTALANSKTLPPGLTRDTVAAAQGRLDELRTEWTGATAAFASGRLEEAVAKGEAARARAEQLMQVLGMQAPAAVAAAPAAG
jgi:hypothetical protein